mgnify:CR=1 FL=1
MKRTKVKYEPAVRRHETVRLPGDVATGIDELVRWTGWSRSQCLVLAINVGTSFIIRSERDAAWRQRVLIGVAAQAAEYEARLRRK